jgi:hypothetical protein
MATRVISVGNIVVGESDGSAVFTVTLDAPSTSVVSVSYNDASGTAVAPTDFLGVSGTLTFQPGETVKTVQVPIVDAASAVPKGDFFFNLFNPVNAVIGNTTAVATIIANDEPSGTPLMSIDNPVVDATAARVTFAVSLNRPSTGTVTVNYATAAGTDTANDFTPVSGTLSFAPGETEKNVTVLLTNGTTPGPEESFNLVLSGVSGATLPNAVGTALIGPSNQPTVVTPEISVANVTVSESDAYAEFVVRLNASSTSVVSVSYNDASGTAVAPTDFLGVSGALTFAPGETVKTVRVPIVDAGSTVPKGDFSFNLFNPVNAVIGNTTALATIIANDEPSGTPLMSIDNPVVDATAAQVTFAVSLNRPSTGTVTVNYATAAGTDTANDFTPVSGTLSFAPGETEKNVTVLLTNGTTPEPEESFNLVLSGVSGATLPNAVGTALIGPSNQPTVSTPQISLANVTVSESDAYAEFVVRLNAPSTSVVSVSYNDASGTAVAPTDFLGVSGALTFAPGETVKTVRVPIVDDLSETDVETFSFNLFNPVHATIATPSATATIEPVCFVRGTRVATPTGEVPVEALSVGGDVLTTLCGVQPVKWIGRRRIDLTAHLRPETVAPVRIQRGAFADDIPHKDLLLSPDHSIFVDGKLICARQLINGITIRQEIGWRAVEYFHVKLDAHAILLAEGLPTESYLDTGNRGFFANSNEPLLLHPDLTDETDHPTREAGSCAPFVWDEANVRPVWQRLADRAAAMGHPMQRRAITTNPDLGLLVNQRSLKPVHSDRDLVIFVLPPSAKELQLLSRAQPPAEARPWLEDRRKLGVRVKRIVLRGANELQEIPMDHPDLTKGWWDIERDGQVMSRWTNGDATVSLPKMAGHVMLEVHLAGEMIYTLDAEPESQAEHHVA